MGASIIYRSGLGSGKVSGCWRTTTGADLFLALRSYISTTRKHGRDTIDALAQLAKHQPWLPAAAGP